MSSPHSDSGLQRRHAPPAPQSGAAAAGGAIPTAPAGAPLPDGYGAWGGVLKPYGHQTGGQQATIDLTVQGSVLMRSFVPPTVRVNGHALNPEYGQRAVPVPPGPVHIDVVCQWMRAYGQASISFAAQPGQTVPVFYAAPAHQFTTGAMGHTPQKHKGLGLIWGILGVAVAVILLALLPTFFLG